MLAKIENGVVTKWPLAEHAIQATHPNTSFAFPLSDETIEQFGFARFEYADPPQHDVEFEVARELTPTLDGIVATQAWEIVEKYTDEEKAAYLIEKEAARSIAVKQTIIMVTQERLDAFARTRNYDDILSASTYANSAVAKFAAEGQYCVGARDATWAKLYDILAEVEAGTRPVPSGFADVESELPALEWPSA